jgi:hypothetical protein
MMKVILKPKYSCFGSMVVVKKEDSKIEPDKKIPEVKPDDDRIHKCNSGFGG